MTTFAAGLFAQGAFGQQAKKCEMLEHPSGAKYLECDPVKIAEAKTELERAKAERGAPSTPGYLETPEQFKARMDTEQAKTEEQREADREAARKAYLTNKAAEDQRAETKRREQAAAVKAAEVKAAAQPIALKNLAPGMTTKEIRLLYPQFSCRVYDGDEVCSYFSEYTSIHGYNESLSTVAGAQVKSWFIPIRNGRSVSVIVTLASSEFDHVKAAMAERFGKPTSQETSTVTNRMGAKFDQTVTAWVRRGSVLQVQKRSSQVDEMRVLLTIAEAMKDADAASAAKTKKGAKDL